jgi:hypothetical protein
MNEISIKTKGFRLKPVNYLIYTNPILKGGVMDSCDSQSFNPNKLIFSIFLY